MISFLLFVLGFCVAITGCLGAIASDEEGERVSSAMFYAIGFLLIAASIWGPK